ncbi:MAG TPA: hypothetical protein VFR67_26980 [Pilimelia sp.]|nr:hypothetical protein [Pilimelia sp.]
MDLSALPSIRRVVPLAAALLLSVAGCSPEPESVPHAVRYDLNMVGSRAFADITASYTQANGFDTSTTVFAASWSHEVTVRAPEVEFVRLSGTFEIRTQVPEAQVDPAVSRLRCRIHVDGKLVAERTAYDPSCTFKLSDAAG